MGVTHRERGRRSIAGTLCPHPGLQAGLPGWPHQGVRGHLQPSQTFRPLAKHSSPAGHIFRILDSELRHSLDCLGVSADTRRAMMLNPSEQADEAIPCLVLSAS